MLCFSIGSGSGGGTYNPRFLQLIGDATNNNKLQFRIYQGPGVAPIWGTKNDTASGNPVALGPFLANNQITPTYTGSLSLYSTVASSQSTALKGDYESGFMGSANAAITWKTLTSPNAVTPDMCSSGTTDVGTFDFTVKATVANLCYATAADLDFGSVSSVAAGPITGQAKINVQCTNGTPYQVGLDNGSNSTGGTNRSMKDPATARLVRYDLYQDAPRSVRWGNTEDVDTLKNQTGSGKDNPITVYGQAYPDTLVTVGNYSDTVSVKLYF